MTQRLPLRASPAVPRPPEEDLRSVARALDILQAFGRGQPELGVTELARVLRLSKSTVHRLLRLLASRGVVAQDPATRRYRLGVELLWLGSLVRDGMDLRREALPVMRELQARAGETVNLNVERDGHRVCIEKVETSHPIRDFVDIGRPLPLYAGASGKVLLAHLPDQRVAEILRAADPAAIAGRLPTGAALRRELARIRRQGYASTSGERVEGASSVSAPVWDAEGRVVASLSISGPSYRFRPERVRVFARLVVSAAREISGRLGHRSSGRPEGRARR